MSAEVVVAGGRLPALDSQFYAFLALCLAGVASGLLFDLLRVVRLRLRRQGPAGAAADLLCWALITLVLGTGLFLGNWGDLRFYVPVALCTGAFLYFTLAGPVTRWLMDLGVGALLWVWDLLCYLAARLLVAPAIALATTLWRIVYWAGCTGRRLGMALAELVLRPVRPAYRRVRHWTSRSIQTLVARWMTWLLGPPPEDPPTGDERVPPGRSGR